VCRLTSHEGLALDGSSPIAPMIAVKGLAVSAARPLVKVFERVGSHP
jgi:hypothetical protein